MWRNEAFGTTFEPAVFVYNKRLLAPGDVPQTHAALAQLLRDQSRRFKGKVDTYDIEKVGVGFLLATQDSMTSNAFWDLARAMFDAGAFLHPTTGAMMERIASGESLIGYNLLGSYAIVRAKTDPSIGYVMPRDYTLVMSRIVFISRQALHPRAARLWVDFLLSRPGQEIIANESQLFSFARTWRARPRPASRRYWAAASSPSSWDPACSPTRTRRSASNSSGSGKRRGRSKAAARQKAQNLKGFRRVARRINRPSLAAQAAMHQPP